MESVIMNDTIPYEDEPLEIDCDSQSPVEQFVVPNDNPHFSRFVESIKHHRVSEAVDLGWGVFTCRFALAGVDVWVNGDISIGDTGCVETIKDVSVSKIVMEEDGQSWAVPYRTVNLSELFEKLTERFVE